MPSRDPSFTGTYALVCPETGAGIRFSQAPWPGLPEEVLVESRKRRGAWGRNGIVSLQRARELWRQHRQKGWLPGS
jgi:phosphoserine phosphatase